MARYKKRQSAGDVFFEDLVSVSSILPWWVSISLAGLLFYFVPFGGTPDIQPLDSSSMTSWMLGFFFKALFKFLIPAGLVLGVVINIFLKLKSLSLFKSIQTQGAHKTVQDLSWQDFEFLLSEWFKKEGYSTELVGGGGADGGIDIKLYKDGGLYLVQCKHYKAWKVPVTVVRELYGVMAAEKAVGGFVVASGRFTNEAIAFASDKTIDLIDGKKLTSILDSSTVIPPSESQAQESICPKCGSTLVQRKGKYGNFIGCSAYPKCDFTKAYS